MSSRKSIILLSGGLDSVVSLAAKQDEYNITLALTFDYGQRAKDREIESAKALSKHFGIEHVVIKLDFLEKITQTSLVNTKNELPALKSSELDSLQECNESAKNVWVPNRNGLFLNIAASYADSYNYTHIIFGANKEEGTTFPDNTQDFIDRINTSFEYSTLVKPKVFAPLINLTKKEIVELGVAAKTPFSLVRSCYTNNQKHCGACESCLRLKRALEQAGQSGLTAEIFEGV